MFWIEACDGQWNWIKKQCKQNILRTVLYFYNFPLLPTQVISVKKSDFEVFDALDIDSSSVSGSQSSGAHLFSLFRLFYYCTINNLIISVYRGLRARSANTSASGKVSSANSATTFGNDKFKFFMFIWNR